jgi:flavin reductase (DIM6/NTAB) family NADH-FMN oxidoreductase RutF
MAHRICDHTPCVERDIFIAAMRRVASSVTVVTTHGAYGRHGATVSAFSSVSADPPTVLICLFAASRIAEAVIANGRFCVNVLPETGARIADRFAGRHDKWCDDRFAGIELMDGRDAPHIKGATGFDCTLDQSMLSGSHLIVTGHVGAVAGDEIAPLAYRDGGYHRVVPYDVSARN